jgi:hypothetical protein
MMLNSIWFRKKNFLMVLRSSTGAQWTVKNENPFSTAKITSFYSEFNADSAYVILFKKYCGQKSGLTAHLSFGILLKFSSWWMVKTVRHRTVMKFVKLCGSYVSVQFIMHIYAGKAMKCLCITRDIYYLKSHSPVFFFFLALSYISVRTRYHLPTVIS